MCNCNNIEIGVKKLQDNVVVPKQANPGDSGFDVCSTINKVIKPLERVLVPTGLSFEIPEGFEIQVRPRSGLALKHGITVLNTPGTIDWAFRGEVRILLINLGQDDYEVKIGDRVAQLVPARVTSIKLNEVFKLNDTVRGSNGFGSSGS